MLTGESRECHYHAKKCAQYWRRARRPTPGIKNFPDQLSNCELSVMSAFNNFETGQPSLAALAASSNLA